MAAARRARPERALLVGWNALLLAITLDVAQVFILDGSDGLRRPTLLPLVAVGFVAELWLFARTLRGVRAATAYAAYGVTPVVVTVVAAVAFREHLSAVAIAGVLLVVLGVVLLSTDEAGAEDPRVP